MGGSTGEDPKKVNGSYTGIYKFEEVRVDEPKYPVAFFKNVKKDSFSKEYAMDMEIFLSLGRPNKIKVNDYVEAVE